MAREFSGEAGLHYIREPLCRVYFTYFSLKEAYLDWNYNLSHLLIIHCLTEVHVWLAATLSTHTLYANWF